MIGKALIFLALISVSSGLNISSKNNAKFDLSSIMNLLPSLNNNLGGLNTSGMSLSDIMKLIELIKELHDLKDNVSAIAQDILTAINATAQLLTASGFNLTQLTQHEVAGRIKLY